MLTRRTFVAGAAAAPYVFVPTPGRPAPSERVTMGLIGCGGMGTANMGAFMDLSDVQFVAVCDVDTKWALTKGSRDFYGSEPAMERVEKKYAEQAKSGTFKGCSIYKDFRELCARKDIDAVVVATPDHWHARAALEALRNGKDVYGEKPITHRFGEGRVLADTVKKHGRIWQTGSQQRSDREFIQAVELVRNGVIGKVQHIEVGLPTGHQRASGDLKEQEPPDHLDYDFWCGPSKKLPYVPARLHWNWRWTLTYGGGQLMDWIGHHNDIAHWGMDLDEGGPVEIEAVGFKYPDDRSVWDAAYAYEVLCRYEKGFTTSIANKYPNGLKWIGDMGWVFVARGEIKASNPQWLESGFKPGPVQVTHTPGHRRNFIDGVKSRKPCVCPAETSHRSITPGHLGLVAEAVGRKLKWDPKTETIVGDAEADKLLKAVPYRAPWKLEG
jgi:predicted dehydrogenase